MKELVQSCLQFSIAVDDRLDWYRLQEGRLEFRQSGAKGWRPLNYPEIEHHLALSTPVGKWLGHLNSLSELARFLCAGSPDETLDHIRSEQV